MVAIAMMATMARHRYCGYLNGHEICGNSGENVEKTMKYGETSGENVENDDEI